MKTEWFRAAPGTNWAITLSHPVGEDEPVVALSDFDGYPCVVQAYVSDTDPRMINVYTVSGLEVEGSLCVTYLPAVDSSVARGSPGRCQIPVVRSAWPRHRTRGDSMMGVRLRWVEALEILPNGPERDLLRAAGMTIQQPTPATLLTLSEAVDALVNKVIDTHPVEKAS